MTKTEPPSAAPKDTPAPRAPSGLRSPRAIAFFLILAAAALVADLASKHYVFQSLMADRESLADRVVRVKARYEVDHPREMLHLLALRKPLGAGVSFTLSTNPGVVFGLRMPRWAVAAATVVTLGLIVFFFASSPARAYVAHTAMALILAGALGNLHDRLFSRVDIPGMDPIRYEVRDFIDCSELTTIPAISKESLYPWIFNVADIWLVVGVCLLLVHWILEGRRQARSGRQAPDKRASRA